MAVISPAGPIGDRAALERGLERLRSWGLRPQLGEHALARDGYLAGDDSARLGDLQSALDDADVRAILCTRGGYGCHRLLPRIDWSPLERDPRALLGYSDVTALHVAAWQEVGLVGLHGPMVATRDAYASGTACDALQRALLVDAAKTPGLPAPDRTWTITPGTAQGRLVGGNLSLVQSLLGTPWQLATDGALLFLEDVDEPLYRLDRMLTQLRSAGCFDGVAGVVIGDVHLPGTELGSVSPSVLELLRDRLGDLGVPVAAGFPIGHRPEAWTLPFGGLARLVATENRPELQLLAD